MSRLFRFGIYLFLGLGSSLLGGCVPLLEPDVTLVLDVPVDALVSPLFWKVVAIGGVAFLLRMMVAVRAPMMNPARWMGFLLVSMAVQVVLSRSFLGTWAYMGIEVLSELAGVGPVLLVVAGMILGLRKGMAGVFPVLLYFLYRDETLLRFVAMPAFFVHGVDALYLGMKLKHHVHQDADSNS